MEGVKEEYNSKQGNYLPSLKPPFLPFMSGYIHYLMKGSRKDQ